VCVCVCVCVCVFMCLCVVIAHQEASFQVLDLTQDTKVTLVIFIEFKMGSRGQTSVLNSV